MRVFVPSRAPYQLQPYSSSHKDSTQVQSLRGGNVVDASQSSSFADEGGLSSLHCVDAAISSSCKMSLNKEATKPSLSG